MFQKFSRESVGGVFRQWQIPNENGEACNKAFTELVGELAVILFKHNRVEK